MLLFEIKKRTVKQFHWQQYANYDQVDIKLKTQNRSNTKTLIGLCLQQIIKNSKF